MRRATVALLPLILAGCGYVGDPLPPALDIPVQVVDLNALQRGDQIVLTFKPELLSTEKLPLKKFEEIELRAGVASASGSEFNADLWAAGAQRFVIPSMDSEPVRFALDVNREWIGKEIVFGVRPVGPTSRPSAWSNLVTLRIFDPPMPPDEIKAAGSAEGVVIEWRGATGDDIAWRVLRQGKDDQEPIEAGRTQQPHFVDPAARFGERYTYTVQLLRTFGDRTAESEPSRPVSWTHQDRFAPAIPKGLTAAAGLASIELAWDRNPESDLKGYILYRASGDGPLEKFGDPVGSPSYSDGKLEAGKRYRYAVASVDEAGNESKPCEPVEATAPPA